MNTFHDLFCFENGCFFQPQAAGAAADSGPSTSAPTTISSGQPTAKFTATILMAQLQRDVGGVSARRRVIDTGMENRDLERRGPVPGLQVQRNRHI